MCCAMALVVCSLLFFGCSKSEDVEPKKGAIEEMTDHAADVIVDKIKSPIDKARKVKEVEEERAKGIDETLNQK